MHGRGCGEDVQEYLSTQIISGGERWSGLIEWNMGHTSTCYSAVYPLLTHAQLNLLYHPFYSDITLVTLYTKNSVNHCFYLDIKLVRVLLTIFNTVTSKAKKIGSEIEAVRIPYLVNAGSVRL